MKEINQPASVEPNRSEGGCILRIDAVYPSLKRAEQRLADYIRDHPQRVIQSTINTVQKESGSSYATIIRFCKRLGYKGFKELKVNLEKDIAENKTLTNYMLVSPIRSEDGLHDIVEKVFLNSIQTLQDSRTILNETVLDKAADMLARARSVYFIGTGISGVCARYAYTRFFRIGISCLPETDATIYKINTSLLAKGDLLFAISSSGRSRSVVEAARIARDRKVSVISLSDFALSPLTKVSDVNLYTSPRNSTQFSNLDVQLFIAQINILDILFFSVCSRLGERALEALNKTKKYSDLEKM